MKQDFERPFLPTETTGSNVTSFSLLELAGQLMKEDVINHSGKNSLTLARGNDLTVVLLVLKDQAVLHEHNAPGPISVTVLSGHIKFSTKPESFNLRTGDTTVCAAHLPHSVKAQEDSAFLLVIGGRVD